MVKANSEADWAFCRQSLLDVSRTFSKPIEMLPGPLEVAVTCGYLLCRLADTIEDEAGLAPDHREALYDAFLAVIERDGDASAFVSAFDLEGESAEYSLCRNLPRVMRVLGTLEEPMQRAVLPWVAEMTRGMAIYSRRRPGDDGFTALLTEADLERYCYFVAGTVGHMLTDLFAESIQGLDGDRERTLRAHAEHFGLGLQLVNILKDITDDRERGWSFVPRSTCAAVGLSIATLTDPDRRADAHRALATLFERADAFLDDAFEYCLAIPCAERPIRLFCLLPLWMAVRTLAHARGNDDQLLADRPVKISRDEVMTLIEDCVARAGDDAALREGFRALRV